MLYQLCARCCAVLPVLLAAGPGGLGCTRADAVTNPSTQAFTRSGGATKPAAADFTLRVADTYGNDGYIFWDVTPEAVRVTVRAEWDEGRNPPKELYRSKLTPTERQRLSRFLATLPLDSMKDVYDGLVWDGWGLYFEIQTGGHATKKIEVRNVRQPELMALCREVNRLVPEKNWIRPHVTEPSRGAGGGG